MNEPRRAIPRSAVLILLLAFVVVGQSAQPSIRVPFKRIEVMITMRDKKNLVFLVECPWNHGGWRSKGRSLAQVDFVATPERIFTSRSKLHGLRII